MPSIFEISVAAFAIGMATNANVPNSAPPAPQKPQIVVEEQAEASKPAPAAKPDQAVDMAQAAATADADR